MHRIRGESILHSHPVPISSLQFTPPFSYSYQCSASFITSYSRAFIFVSISTVFVHPALQYILQRVYARSAGDSLMQRAVHRSAAWGLSAAWGE